MAFASGDTDVRFTLNSPVAPDENGWLLEPRIVSVPLKVSVVFFDGSLTPQPLVNTAKKRAEAARVAAWTTRTPPLSHGGLERLKWWVNRQI